MPTRPTERHIPPTLTPGDLGESTAAADPRCLLVSFITSPLVVDRLNTYVVFVTDDPLAAGTARYEWSFALGESEPETQVTDAGETTYRPKAAGELQVSVRLPLLAMTVGGSVADPTPLLEWTELPGMAGRGLGQPPPQPPPAAEHARVRYQVMSSVPENWIPFIPVHVPGDNREIQLQRASMPRLIDGDPDKPRAVRPRTSLLRPGLDTRPRTPYFLHEEEVPRAGVRVWQRYRRTRSRDGRVWVWLAVGKQTGRGEGSSGLAFDRLVDVR